MHFLPLALLSFALASCSMRPLPPDSSSETGGSSSSVETRFEIENGEALDLLVGQTATIALRRDGVEGEVSFSSSDPSVATVSMTGLVTALRAGETRIEARCGDFSDALLLTVRDPGPVPVPRVELLSEPSMNLSVGESQSVLYAISHSEEQVKFSSSVPNLISYQFLSLGEVRLTGWLEGETVVTLSIPGGNAVEIDVTVAEKKPTSLVLSSSKEEIYVGEEATLSVSSPEGAPLPDLSFEAVEGGEHVEISGMTLRALSSGNVTLRARCGEVVSNAVSLRIYDFRIAMDAGELALGEHQRVRVSAYSGSDYGRWQWRIEDPSVARLFYSPLGDLYVESLEGRHDRLLLVRRGGPRVESLDLARPRRESLPRDEQGGILRLLFPGDFLA